jgi:hypothetical protein
MTMYSINASRTIDYEFEIEANSEQEAIAIMNTIELSENAEEYAYNWYPMQVIEINGKDK